MDNIIFKIESAALLVVTKTQVSKDDLKRPFNFEIFKPLASGHPDPTSYSFAHNTK